MYLLINIIILLYIIMNHYFIGKFLNQDDQKKLFGKQTYLSKNLPITNKVENLNTKFAYLGYFDDLTMLELQDKLNNVMESITSYIDPINAIYKNYSITGLKTTKKNISILYDCPIITDIVVPYIRSYTNQFTEDTSDFYPHISLLRFDAKNLTTILNKTDNKGNNILENTFLPEPNTFLLDSIDIMKGVPKFRRSGPSSRYDDMDITIIHRYNI